MSKFTKILFIFLLSCWLSISNAFSQGEVRGKVTDESGEPIVGATVLEKGTDNGAVTDLDGNYALQNVQDDAVLKVSFIGFITQSVAVNGRSTIDISMEPNVEELDEVVVTALGFKVDRDEVGYANSQVDDEEIVKAAEPNLINSLSGKATGVNITRNSGDPGAGAYIQIRGASTLGGDGQPLIIVDGVPINSSSSGTSQIAQQSRLNDINPNDIENISVLKGAPAAALWGTLALNGAIVITTKSGKYNEKLKVSVKSTYSLDQINRRYPLQDRFGQGDNGTWNPTSSRSWGDRIADRAGGTDEFDTSGEYFVDQDGRVYYPVLSKNSKETYLDENFNQIFGNGYFFENNVSLTAGDETGNIYFNVSNLNQKGIIKKNSDYGRTSARLNIEKLLNEDFSLNVNVGYTRTSSNRIRRGSQSSGLYVGLTRTAADFNNIGYRGSYYPSQNGAPVLNRHRSYRNHIGAGGPGYTNPLWTVNEQQNLAVSDRFINNIKLKFSPVKWFELISRTGLDVTNETTTEFFTPGAAGGRSNGYFQKDVDEDIILNTDLISRFNKKITDDIFSSLLIGFNYQQRTSLRNINTAENFIQFADVSGGIRDINNALPENRSAVVNEFELRKAAFYGELSIEAFKSLFVTATLRNEASSTYGPLADQNVLFPSVNVAWQFDNLINTDFLSFGKLRTSYGQVGRDPNAYRTNNEIVAPNYGDGLGGSLNVAQYGLGGFTRSFSLGNLFLGPELKTEFEIGTDLRFINNRISLSATYYNNTTENLIIDLPIANTRGYDEITSNAAVINNQGYEIDLGFKILQSEDLNLSTNLLYYTNENLVTDLAGTDRLPVGEGLGPVDASIIEGQSLGVLFGSATLKDNNGNIIFDENGFPLANQEGSVIGDSNPDWRGSMITNLTYKNFGLSFLIETYQGADIFAGTKGVLKGLGTWGSTSVETTATQNLLDYDGNVIPAGTKFRGTVEDFGAGPVALTEAWYKGDGGYFTTSNYEHFVEDGSWTRLRRLELSYSLSSSWIQEKGFESIVLSATGRNLILITPFEGNDPDTNLDGISNSRGFDYFNNPSTKSYVFSVQLNF